MMIITSSFTVLLAIVSCISAQNQVVSFQNRIDTPEYADPDSYGYRYCAYWKLANGVRLWTDCDPFVFNRCGQPITFEYRCCVQFRSVVPEIFPVNPSGKRKCAAVRPQWDYCPNVLENIVGYRAFAAQLKWGDLMSDKTTNTFTIFAPYTRNQMTIEDLFGKFKDRQGSNPLAHHVVKNRVYARDLRDGMTLETIYGTKLKVTKYSYGVTCVDCVELVDADYECKNGIIHMISKPLKSPKGLLVDGTSVLSSLMADSRTKTFANDMSSALQAELRQADSSNWFTVFAPTEEQWLKVRAQYPDAAVRERIALNHVVRKMHCSAGIVRHTANIATAEGELLTAECGTQRDETLKQDVEVRYVINQCGQKRLFLESDISAGNGVIHIIDGPLTPMSVLSLNDVLECGGANLGFKEFTDYIKGCDLRMESGKKYAVLIPMDYAFKWWRDYVKFKPEYDRFQTDAEYRCRVARYHITAYNDELERVGYLWHEQTGYQTNNIDMRHEVDYFLKYQYRSDLYFHYSPVVNFEAIRFGQGSFYRLQRINVIPEKFMIDILKEREDLSIAYDKVVFTDLDTKVFKPNRPLNLYLATVNKKWKDQNQNFIEEYNWVEAVQTNLQLLHVVPLYLWGGDIGYFQPNTVQRFMSRLGVELTFHYDKNMKMRIGHNATDDGSWFWAEVIEFNLHAIDGMIWLLDGLLPCSKKYCNYKIVEFELYDVYVAACILKEFGNPVVDMEVNFKRQPYDFTLNHTDTCVYDHQATYMAIKKPVQPLKKP